MTAPNILLILIDDLGCRDLGCFGSSFYETPHLDRLAAEGMVFDNAYASCPVCSPTRASIMSGKYPARVGVTQYIGGAGGGKLADVPYLHYLPLEERSLASSLRDGGYQTWHLGKWHLGDERFHPEHHGFDVNIGGCHWGHPKQGFFAPWGIETLDEADVEPGTYLTDHLTDRAIDCIRRRDPGRPFFMHLSHYAVHTPIQAPKPLVERYRRKAARLRLDQVDPMVVGEPLGATHMAGHRVTRRVLQSNPVYAAMVENLDHNIGRVLQCLDEQGLGDDTLVLFTSDNGGLATMEGSPTCNAPYAEGKGWGYEGGVRVCQMARWPGRIRAGARCAEAVTSTDFYPTFLSAAGLPLQEAQHCDGVDLLPVLEEQTPRLGRDAVFWHYPHYSNQGGSPCAAMLSHPWKLLWHFEHPDEPELYHLEDDPGESENLADREPERTARMRDALRAWQRSVEARIPQPDPDWVGNRVRPEVPNNAHE